MGACRRARPAASCRPPPRSVPRDAVPTMRTAASLSVLACLLGSCASDPPETSSHESGPPARLAALSDAELTRELERCSEASKSAEHDACLLEVVRRGGSEWERYLWTRLAQEQQRDLSDRLDLQVLTAVRRLRKEP